MRRLREKLDEAEILAVVKADAYGHGVDRVAPMLAATGIGWFGVAFAAEGAELREADIEGEFLVLGRRAPVVGAVSMDMTFVDLTDIRLPRRYLTAPCSGPARTGVST